MIIRDASDDEVAWDGATDIVVIGGGGAGLVSATAASEFDMDILLLEKQQ